MGILEKRKLSNHGVCPSIYLIQSWLICKLTCAIAKKPDREVEGREVEVVVIIMITQTFGWIVTLLCFTTRLGSGSPVGNSFTIPKTEALPRRNGWDPELDHPSPGCFSGHWAVDPQTAGKIQQPTIQRTKGGILDEDEVFTVRSRTVTAQ